MKKLDVSEITATEGRIYQKKIYSVPYEIRQFLTPESTDEGNFFYFDLSSAELALNANYYHDEKLSKDIADGIFWEKWVGKYGTSKEILKRCLYAISYSVSDISFPPEAPKTFFEDFKNEYPIFFGGLAKAKWVWENYPQKFNGKYRNLVTNSEIKLPLPTEHHSTFKMLNYRIQQSLSSFMQILCDEICKTENLRPYCLNFDSLLFTWKNHNENEVKQLILETMENLVKNGKLPCKIPFKTKQGKNFAEAQGWQASN